MDQGRSALLDDLVMTPLPGAHVIARIRRLLVTVLIAGVLYGWLNTAGRSGCLGDVDASGGVVDSAGNATDLGPLCYSLSLQPSPFLYATLAVIVLVALGRVLKKTDVLSAVRVLDRAALAVGILVAFALVVSHVWFWLIPVDEWRSDQGIFLIAPFPFGGIDLDVELGSGT